MRGVRQIKWAKIAGRAMLALSAMMLALAASGGVSGCASGGGSGSASAGGNKPQTAASNSNGKNGSINRWLTAKADDLPAPEYRVNSPDRIIVSAPRIRELNGTGGVVKPDGTIDLNLVGTIKVNDLTPAEIAEQIVKRASKYYQKDALDVSVKVTEFNSKVLYVFGQVVQPGVKPFTGRDTVLRVLAAAKLNELAWPQRVIVVRPNEDDPSRRQRVTIDLKHMYETGSTEQDYVLDEGDVIFVPPSPLAQFSISFSALLFPVRPVTTIALLAAG